jgi:Arc/MetJ-type ribon-helix-helix transcriptional regulator
MKMTLTKTKKKQKTNMKRTTIFLTAAHHEELRRLAYEKRTSMANLIREAVLEILELEEDEAETLKAVNETEEGSIGIEEYHKKRIDKEKAGTGAISAKI